MRRGKALMRKLCNNIRWALATETFCCDPEDALQKLAEIAPSPGTSAITDNQIGSVNSDLTIIVPAYNAQRWIHECVDSILSQKTNYTYQVILVDDGSKDGTPEALDSYAEDPRVLVIHQENRGHSGARNTALKLVQSKYIMFVDSDDRLLPGAIEVLLNVAYSNYADIVEGNGYCFDDQGILGPIKKTSHSVSKEDLWGGPCLKVISSHLFARLQFPMGYLYEDTIMAMLVFPLAENTISIPDNVYGYRIHSDSITQTHTAEMNRVHSFWIMLLLDDHQKELGIPRDYANYRMIMRHIIFTYRRCILLPDHVKRLIFTCTGAFLFENYGEYCNTHDEYYRLSKALRCGQFGRYCVLCETMR